MKSGYLPTLLKLLLVMPCFFALPAVMVSCERSKPPIEKVIPPDPPKPTEPDPDPEVVVTLQMVDANATPATKALYSWLWKIAETGFMFGHHDDLWYGRSWQYTPGGSDTKAVCGAYPAVFSMDFASMMDSRASSPGEVAENAHRIRVIKEAFARGEVITGCAHINNPKTERSNGNWDAYPTGTSWDNTSVMPDILTSGSDINGKFLLWLDRLAAVANSLKSDDGTLIPVIFRPFHEHTQGWNWWGKDACTESQFIELWRMTVRYLRDDKGVSNLIYAISPQMDGWESKDRITYRWPGDSYVDFIGMDCYHGYSFGNFAHNLELLQSVAQEKKKPCGVTETGAEAFTTSDYWSKGIMAPMEGKKISMVVMWRNKYVGNNTSDTHYYSVFPGHPSEGDFKLMYNHSRSYFSGQLPAVYTLAPGTEVK